MPLPITTNTTPPSLLSRHPNNSLNNHHGPSTQNSLISAIAASALHPSPSSSAAPLTSVHPLQNDLDAIHKSFTYLNNTYKCPPNLLPSFFFAPLPTHDNDHDLTLDDLQKFNAAVNTLCFDPKNPEKLIVTESTNQNSLKNITSNNAHSAFEAAADFGYKTMASKLQKLFCFNAQTLCRAFVMAFESQNFPICANILIEARNSPHNKKLGSLLYENLCSEKWESFLINRETPELPFLVAELIPVFSKKKLFWKTFLSSPSIALWRIRKEHLNDSLLKTFPETYFVMSHLLDTSFAPPKVQKASSSTTKLNRSFYPPIKRGSQLQNPQEFLQDDVLDIDRLTTCLLLATTFGLTSVVQNITRLGVFKKISLLRIIEIIHTASVLTRFEIIDIFLKSMRFRSIQKEISQLEPQIRKQVSSSLEETLYTLSIHTQLNIIKKIFNLFSLNTDTSLIKNANYIGLLLGKLFQYSHIENNKDSESFKLVFEFFLEQETLLAHLKWTKYDRESPNQNRQGALLSIYCLYNCHHKILAMDEQLILSSLSRADILQAYITTTDSTIRTILQKYTRLETLNDTPLEKTDITLNKEAYGFHYIDIIPLYSLLAEINSREIAETFLTQALPLASESALIEAIAYVLKNYNSESLNQPANIPPKELLNRLCEQLRKKTLLLAPPQT